MDNIYSITVSRETRKGHGEILVSRVVNVGKIVLDRKLFEARIRKEVLPTNPDEAVKLM